MLGFFRNSKKNKNDLRDVLKHIHKTEAMLWKILENGSKVGVEAELKQLSQVVMELHLEMSKLEGSEHDFVKKVHNDLGKQVVEDLNILENLLKSQLHQLQDIVNKSQEEIEIILNGEKKGDLSQTSKILNQLLEKLEGEVEQVANIENGKTYKLTETYDNFLVGFHEAYEQKAILDLKEILKARIEDPSLFGEWVSSGWSIAYKKDSTKFKIIKDVGILKTFGELKHKNENYISINYDSIKEGDLVKEFDYKTDSSCIVNEKLNEDQFKQHSVWKFIFDFENNTNLMSDYWIALNRNSGMRIAIIKEITTSQLRPLSINIRYDVSDINGYNIDNNGRFLLGVPKQ
jgi:hypothetical protein